MIAESIIIFIIIFVLANAFDDSFFALFLLLILNIYEITVTVTAVTTESSALPVGLLAASMMFIFGKMTVWLQQYRLTEIQGRA